LSDLGICVRTFSIRSNALTLLFDKVLFTTIVINCQSDSIDYHRKEASLHHGESFPIHYIGRARWGKLRPNPSFFPSSSSKRLPIDFPITDLLDPQACYDELVLLLHPEALRCPNGHPLAECYVHKRDRAPVVDYRCKVCGRRFNAFTGTVWHGVSDNDRPPVLGVVGRPSGQLHLHVADQSTRPGSTVHTDEWGAYNPLSENQRGHATVNHGAHPWARDDDGGGIRQVHCNTAEGLWTPLRNFLRTFRGVNRVYLQQYAARYAGVYRIKTPTIEFLRILLGVLTPERA